jgi:LacI family transcriptional regulator
VEATVARREVLDGELDGRLRRTIYDIASRAAVSPATVSRYLNSSGYVGAAARERIATAVADLEYQPSQAARALRSRRTGMVVLAVPNIANPQWAEMARAMEMRLREDGLSMVLINVEGGRERELAAIDQAHRLHADGLAISMMEFQPGDFRRLRRSGTRVLRLGRDIYDPTIDGVLTDRVAAIRLGVEHLIGLGHGRVALVDGPAQHLSVRARVESHDAALNAAGLEASPALLIHLPELTAAAGRAAAGAVRRSGATAAVTANDALAIGLWLGLEQEGLVMPRDFSIVGTDNIEAAALVRGGLTTVALDRREFGRMAAELLIQRINGTRTDPPCQIFIQPRLVVRASTAPPPERADRAGKRRDIGDPPSSPS